MTAPRFFHFASVLVLFAWSGVMLYFYASGRVDHILTENFRIGPLIGGLGLAVVGFFNLFTTRSEAACCHDHGSEGHEHEHAHSHSHDHAPADEGTSNDHPHEGHADCCGGEHGHGDEHKHAHTHAHAHEDHHDHHHHHHDGHDHGHVHSHDDQTIPGILATLIIVLVPAIGAAALSQDKFSLETLANKGLYSNEVVAPVATAGEKDGTGGDEDRYTLADLEKQVRKSEEGNFLIPVPSLFYSAADEELADVLHGQPIETTGQIAPEIEENDPDGTRLRLYRLFVSCCLADARPIGFSADFGKAPPEFADDTWVKIIGKMVYPDQDGRRIPVISVDTIETIPEPEDMMY